MGTYILLFVEGLLSFVSPCFLPMLPIYFMYLAGDKTSGLRQLLWNALGFVSGFTLIYVALGASATSLGQLLQHHRSLLEHISGIVILILGAYYILNALHLLELSVLWSQIKTTLHLPTRQKPHKKPEDLHFFSSLFLGAAICASWTPCLFSFVGSALTLAANSQTVLRGMFMLLIYSLGMGVPFLLCALFFGKLKNFLHVLQKNSNKIRLASGILLLIVGLSMLTGLFGYYLSWFPQRST